MRFAAKGDCSPFALSFVFDSIKAATGGNGLESLAKDVAPKFLRYDIDAAATYVGAVMIAYGNLAMASTLG